MPEPAVGHSSRRGHHVCDPEHAAMGARITAERSAGQVGEGRVFSRLYLNYSRLPTTAG